MGERATGEKDFRSFFTCTKLHLVTASPLRNVLLEQLSFSQLIQSCQKWQYWHQKISQQQTKVTSSGDRPDDQWIKRLSLVQESNA